MTKSTSTKKSEAKSAAQPRPAASKSPTDDKTVKREKQSPAEAKPEPTKAQAPVEMMQTGTAHDDTRPVPKQSAVSAVRESAKQASPSADNIARRAYEIWQRRGHTHGSDVHDWLQAEAELKSVRC